MGSWSGTMGLGLPSSRCALRALLSQHTARLTAFYLRAASTMTVLRNLASLHADEAVSALPSICEAQSCRDEHVCVCHSAGAGLMCIWGVGGPAVCGLGVSQAC